MVSKKHLWWSSRVTKVPPIFITPLIITPLYLHHFTPLSLHPNLTSFGVNFLEVKSKNPPITPISPHYHPYLSSCYPLKITPNRTSFLRIFCLTGGSNSSSHYPPPLPSIAPSSCIVLSP